MPGYIILGTLIIIIGWIVLAYNNLIKLRIRAENGWSQIDIQLKRRHDLIPNLVNTVKGYAAHEKEVFETITKYRSMAMSANNMEEKGNAEGHLTESLNKLMAVVENYPQLKANQNFLALQEELTTTENKIAFARQFYNDTVMRYNTAMQSFPTNIIANIFNFKQKEFLLFPGDRANVNVSFGGSA